MCEVAYHYSSYICDFCASIFQVHSMPFLDFLTRRFILRLMSDRCTHTLYEYYYTLYMQLFMLLMIPTCLLKFRSDFNLSVMI